MLVFWGQVCLYHCGLCFVMLRCQKSCNCDVDTVGFLCEGCGCFGAVDEGRSGQWPSSSLAHRLSRSVVASVLCVQCSVYSSQCSYQQYVVRLSVDKLVLNDPDRFIAEPDWATDPDRFIVELDWVVDVTDWVIMRCLLIVGLFIVTLENSSQKNVFVLGLHISFLSFFTCVISLLSFQWFSKVLLILSYYFDPSLSTPSLSAGTPIVGHVDNLTRLRELCNQHHVWLHVRGYVCMLNDAFVVDFVCCEGCMRFGHLCMLMNGLLSECLSSRRVSCIR